MKKRVIYLCTALFLLASCTGPVWHETDNGEYKLVDNDDGQTLGYSPDSGVEILTVDRYAFKDLNQNGQLIRTKIGGLLLKNGHRIWPPE